MPRREQHFIPVFWGRCVCMSKSIRLVSEVKVLDRHEFVGVCVYIYAHVIISACHFTFSQLQSKSERWRKISKGRNLAKAPTEKVTSQCVYPCLDMGDLLGNSTLSHKTIGHQASLVPLLTDLCVLTSAPLCCHNFLLPPGYLLCSY